jgi:hypothetical protein
VGKGEDMSSAESSCQQGVLTDGEEVEERSHPYEDSCRVVSRVNEDDDKLETFITKEEDQRSILVIGGVEIFLPSSQGEASTDIADATEGQQVETVMEKEEQILKSVPTEEHPVELLTQWEMELKALEDWLGNPEPEGGFQEIAMPEETYQHEEKWKEVGFEPTQAELTGENLSEEEVGQQLSDEKPAGMGTAAEWPTKVTRDEENNMGGRCDLPIDKEEVQQVSLQKKSQPMEQLDEVIEEIRKLMLRSAIEAVSKEKMDRKEPARAAGEMQE